MGDRLVPIDDVALPNKMVAVAVSRDNNSKFAARWAINNLLTHKTNPSLFLIHVRRKQHRRYPFAFLRYAFCSDVFLMIVQ